VKTEQKTSMTRYLALLVVVVGSLFAASVALNFGHKLQDTVHLTASITPNKVGRKPINATYHFNVSVHGRGGTQPDGVKQFDVYVAARQGLKRNGDKFPSPCQQSEIDGKKTIPSKCNEALIGTGTATATAGAAGGKSLGSQKLTLRLYTSHRGKVLYLAVNATGDHPIHNRVIVGHAIYLNGTYQVVTKFTIPDKLQTVPGSLIPAVITHTSMNFGGRVFHGTPFVELHACPPSGRLPSKVVYHFNNGTVRTGTTTITCTR
jgi:hypothetical protein